ncbi:hypothetical protein BO94DRAFT_470027 [Aspergillus sclerotioniger CBS 115572]|uniref:Zn(2)-C6 fungal-type domain-containing protein n=1 Tax=Aspergillus sclerotioniger CBS 115572 TaxID=1450535 RepID=A0A317W8N6_9EURO|nr:hypothetical protein BO94DRAFT_470027 [Aspergillus sclerotioniger CBS 115572]PWY81602.1 hypothetical protein BO94DRAFT_470027 [Aspergillus sclerotioniger CBS 115572]
MSDSGAPSSNRRTRAGTRKSKKGCVTCKIRRVKCGEEKPECSRCTLTGRKCDGYTDISQTQLRQAIFKSAPRHVWSPSPDRNIVLVPGTREERQYVQFFCTQTAHALSGFFPSEFWTKFLPQLSHCNPAVRHAVIAVGALHQRQLQGRLMAANADSRQTDEFTIQQYNKAIRKFLQQMESPTDREFDSMLIQCVLFISLEMLSGNTKQAMDHVEGGLRMLSRHLQDKAADQSTFGRDLSQFFYRQNIQLSYFGRQLMPFTATVSNDFAVLASNKDLVFENINQARDCLTNVMTRALCLIRTVQSHTWTTPQEPIHPSQLQQQLDLLAEFDAWFKAFQILRKRSARATGVLDPRAPLSILCQYYAAVTWLSTCTSLDEMNFDHFYPHFEEIVSAGEKLVELCAKDAPSSATEQFFLDADVMPVLYWTVMRCRHPILRRRTMHTLTRYQAREGMWEKRLHIAVARRYVELEEAALVHLPVNQRLPAAHHRVYDAMIYREMESPSNPCPVLFRTKPHGVDGHWEDRWEHVSW